MVFGFWSICQTNWTLAFFRCCYDILVQFLLAVFWGVTDAIWQTQLNAFYGVLFVDNREAAFSNYRLWESVGFAFFYIITPYIRVRIVLIILTLFLSFGISGYALIEYRCRRKDKAISNDSVSSETMVQAF